MFDIQSIADLSLLRESIDFECKLAHGRDGLGALPEDFCKTYSDRASVLVVKSRDMFMFRNPGLMRIPPEIAIRGGEHDCRNRTLHKMFRLVGIGEQAGSGVPKIYNGWASQHWRVPALFERQEPYNQTLLELRTIDFLPKELLARLRDLFGERFETLQKNERLALALAATEKTITHARVQEMTGLHPFDATRLLHDLVARDFLDSHNQGRGTVYCLPDSKIPTPEEIFDGKGTEGAKNEGNAPATASSPLLADSSPHLASDTSKVTSSSPHLTDNPSKLTSSPSKLTSDPSKLTSDPSKLTSSLPLLPSSIPILPSSLPILKSKRDADGCLVSERLPLPIIENLQALSAPFRESLVEIASEPRSKGKVNREKLIQVVLTLCSGRFITIQALAELVNRKPRALRNEYLTKMLKSKQLTLAFPTTPTHERQAYCATASLPPSS